MYEHAEFTETRPQPVLGIGRTLIGLSAVLLLFVALVKLAPQFKVHPI